jgi:small subunit ribosomal protein S2e
MSDSLHRNEIVPILSNFVNKPLFHSQVTGKCGSVQVRLIPAPRGTGIVSAPVPKKLLQMAGIEDCYTQCRGSTTTLGNFAKATYSAIMKTYAFLTPDLWKEMPLTKTPYETYADFLSKPAGKTGGIRNIEL